MGSKKQALVKKRHQEKKRVKAKPAALAERQRTAAWRNRIVAHGEEAPDQLLANPKNWRIHPEAQKLALKGILDTVGWVGQVLVNRRTGFLVDGHLRVMVALEKNEPVVPVAYVDLSDDEEAMVLTTLDPIAALAGTDKEKLGALIAGAHSDSADVMAMLERLARTQGVHLVNRPCPEPQPDRADELMRKWGVAAGDLWQIGPHRLLCGDCTNAGVVAELTDRMPEPVLMATDPPYGVSYDLLWREEALPEAHVKARGTVQNDDRVDWSEAYRFFPGAIVYVWHAGVHAAAVARHLEGCGFVIRSQIIWVKQHYAMSRGAYHWKHEPCWFGVRKTHEPCWYAVRKGDKAAWTGDRKQNTVWEVDNQNPFGKRSALESQTGHGTQKPVQVYEIPLANHTRPGDVIYEPFAGSGTAFVAAERMGRVCLGIEIDPRWVAVILERMAEMSLKPERRTR